MASNSLFFSAFQANAEHKNKSVSFKLKQILTCIIARLNTQIRFPYGTTVKIAVDGSYLNVWVYSSPPDWKNTIGEIEANNGFIKDTH